MSNSNRVCKLRRRSVSDDNDTDYIPQTTTPPKPATTARKPKKPNSPIRLSKHNSHKLMRLRIADKAKIDDAEGLSDEEPDFGERGSTSAIGRDAELSKKALHGSAWRLKVGGLKSKQDAQAQLLRQKQRSDKLKKEEYEIHKLGLDQTKKMTEEASLATKRLKDILETQKTAGASSGCGVQALLKAIENELDVTVRVHEVRCKYELLKEERLKMTKEVSDLKDEANLSKQSRFSHSSETTMSPGARKLRIYALENMLATSFTTSVSMVSQLSEAEEREQALSGKVVCNRVQSLADAKTVMNNLFTLASSLRCHLWDQDLEIRGLKNKILSLTRQAEKHKPELTSQEKSKGLENSIADCSSLKTGERLTVDRSESEHSDLDETDIVCLCSEKIQDEMGQKSTRNAKERNSMLVLENNTSAEIDGMKRRSLDIGKKTDPTIDDVKVTEKGAEKLNLKELIRAAQAAKGEKYALKTMRETERLKANKMQRTVYIGNSPTSETEIVKLSNGSAIKITMEMLGLRLKDEHDHGYVSEEREEGEIC